LHNLLDNHISRADLAMYAVVFAEDAHDAPPRMPAGEALTNMRIMVIKRLRSVNDAVLTG
jgi:hypothetical protein